MKRLIALFLSLALCLLLAGCWEVETPDASEDFWTYAEDESNSAAEVSMKASAFTLPYLNSQTLDPITCSDGVQQVVGSLLYEGLFALDEHFSPQPLLCSSFSRSSDGLSYTFTLREDVTFSNGANLMPSDVLATYRRAQISERYAARFDNVVSMRISRNTFNITLRRPDSALPALLDIPIVKSGTEKDTVPLGTGPYLFLTDTEGPCLVRNENWWNQSMLPLERIELVSAKDADTAVYLFSAQEAHLLTADLLSETSAASLGNVDIVDAPMSTMLFLGFNTRHPALADSSLRATMSLALDREAIAETLLAGHAIPAQFPISPCAELYPVELETAYSAGAYAPALAVPSPSQGEEPAVSEPLELTLLVNEENGFKTAVAEYLSKQLTAAHITVTPLILPWADYLAALESGSFDLWLGEIRLTADWNIKDLVDADGALNFGGFNDPETSAALRAFLANESADTAAALYARLASQAPFLPLAFKSLSILSPTGLIDGIAPTSTQPLRNLGQWSFHFAA